MTAAPETSRSQLVHFCLFNLMLELKPTSAEQTEMGHIYKPAERQLRRGLSLF